MTKKNFSKKQSLLRKYSPEYHDREDCESMNHDELDWDIENTESEEMEEEYSLHVVAHMPDLNGEESGTAPRHLSRFEKQRKFQIPGISFQNIPFKKFAAGLAVVSVLGLIVWSFLPKSHNSQQVAVLTEESNASIFTSDPVPPPETKVPTGTSLGAMTGFLNDSSPASQPQHAFETTTFENAGAQDMNRFVGMPSQNIQPQQAFPAPAVASPWDQPTTSANHNAMFPPSQPALSVPQQAVAQASPYQNHDLSNMQNASAAWNVSPNSQTVASFPPQVQSQIQPQVQPAVQQQPMYYSNTQAANTPQNLPYQFGETTVPSYYQTAQSTQTPMTPNLPVQQEYQQPNFPVTQESPNLYGTPQNQVPNVAMASPYSQNFDNAGNQQQPLTAQPMASQGQWPGNSYPQTQQSNTFQQNGYPAQQPAAPYNTTTPSYQNVPYPQNGVPQIPAGPARSYKDAVTGYDNSMAMVNPNVNTFPQPSQTPMTTGEYPMTAQPYSGTVQPQTTNNQSPYYIR